MVVQGVDRCLGERVDGVGPDQLVDVERVGVGGVLGRRRRPQRPLQPRAPRRERIPAIAGEGLPEEPVRELGVGHGDLAPQRMAFRQTPVRLGVDAADEEGRHRRDSRQVTALLGVALEPAEVRLDDFGVPGEREDQRDVDGDAFSEALLDRGHTRQRGRDLHEHVGAERLAVQPVDLLDRRGRLVGPVGRHLDGHETVVTVQGVVGGSEHIGGVADVVEDEGPVRRVDGGAALGELGELLVVALAGGHRLLEDRRVGSDPADAVVLDEALQSASGDQLTGEVVVPGALPVLDEAGDGGAGDGHQAFFPGRSRASKARARATTFSGV